MTTTMKIAEFNLTKTRWGGEFIKENSKTVLVRLRRTRNIKIIKRHREKDCVNIL